jgi:glycogen debranching enzyme
MKEGCMGIKTLDPSDKNYKGDYDNSDATNGFNYH